MNKKELEKIPVGIVGVCVDKDYFFAILDKQLDLHKNELKEDEFIFDFLVKKYNCNENLTFLMGDICFSIDDNEMYICIPLIKVNENYSIKRIKIDLFNDLVNMGFVEYGDDVNIISIINEIIDVKDLNKGEKDK